MDGRYIIDVICAYCKKKIGEKPSQHPGVTHGICPDCLTEQDRLLAILVQEEEANAKPEILKAN